MAEHDAHAREHVPFEPAEDVEEAEGWCARCDAVRSFHRGKGDFAALEEQAEVPNVRRAIEGEDGWLCGACGAFRRNLVEEHAYPVAFSNVGAIRGPPELPQGRAKGISEDLELREVSEPGVSLHDPATDPEGLHEDPAVEATLEDTKVEDRALEARIAEDVRAQERGDEALEYRGGSRRPFPPPERVPRKDPLAEE